jgi:transcriptional regulator with XRE-family HTH domain
MEPGNPYVLKSPEEVAAGLAMRLRELRLARNWKQATLAERAGVTLASLRRFERTGQVSLKHLLRLVFVLGRLDEFECLLQRAPASSLRELEAMVAPIKPRRGTR